MKDHEIKQILNEVCGRNILMLNSRIKRHENERDSSWVHHKKESSISRMLDEKIRLRLVKDLFAELKMAFGL